MWRILACISVCEIGLPQRAEQQVGLRSVHAQTPGLAALVGWREEDVQDVLICDR